MKLIDNLPNHLKDKNGYLLKLKDSIDIPIDSIKCRKYGHHVTECGKGEKAKKELRSGHNLLEQSFLNACATCEPLNNP